MQKQLRLSEELVEQLKHVIRAQHAKIEELRGTSDNTVEEIGDMSVAISPHVQSHMLEAQQLELQRSREDREKLMAQVRRLTNQVRELRASNEDLRRAGRRHAGMLAQVSENAAASSLGTSLRPSPSLITPTPQASPAATPIPRLSSSLAIPSVPSPVPEDNAAGPPHLAQSRSMPQLQPHPGEQGAVATPRVLLGACGAAGLQAPSKPTRLAEAARGTVALWREATPQGVLVSLLDGASRLLHDVRGATLTLYVVDAWLRGEMAEQASTGSCVLQSTTYYLSGKETVHAYQCDGLRAEPPQFKSLDALPLRGTNKVIALSLQAKHTDPILAAIQVVLTEGDGDRGGLAESHLTGLELLCRSATGILDLKIRVLGARILQCRGRDCLNITAEVNGARNVTDFEQRAKILLARFFNVGAVRVCFLDNNSNDLISAKDQLYRSKTLEQGLPQRKGPVAVAPIVGRRVLQRFPTKEGIVGRVIRKRQIVHLERLIMSPHLSERADGVDLYGPGGDINMLAGPMLASLGEDGVRVIGVVQLIEKRGRADADSTLLRAASGAIGGPGAARGLCEPFTVEDQDFFHELLRILGLAAYRTMQSLAGASDDVERLLNG